MSTKNITTITTTKLDVSPGDHELLLYGTWGGTTSRILWLIFGLTASGLALSGAMVFARRVAHVHEKSNPTAIVQLWKGMSVLRWGLALLFAVVATYAVMRFGH